MKILTPIIETSRLILRPHKIEDFEACVAMWSEPEIIRYTIKEKAPPQRTWLRILAYRGHWEQLGFGYWAVEEKVSKRFIGEIGFADFKRAMDPGLDGVPELGWVLCANAHGKGFATEALKAAVAWGDSNLEARRTVCLIERENTASFRVAEKLGYQKIFNVKNSDVTVLERLS